jgi:hypothetical protein
MLYRDLVILEKNKSKPFDFLLKKIYYLFFKK